MSHGRAFFIYVLIVIFINLSATAEAANLSLVLSKTDLTMGETFMLNIRIDDASGIAGCAFTLIYPENLLELDHDKTPVSTDFFLLFSDVNPDADPQEAYPWEANTGSEGKIRLSGAYIDTDPDTGGGGNYKGSQSLFTVHFKVKDHADAGNSSFELRQTMLCNGPAGWGVDQNNNGQYDETDGDKYEGAPILLKAYPKGSDQWNTSTLNDDFEVLIDSFTENPKVTFNIAPCVRIDVASSEN
jgi:hypothetical protein